MGKTRINDALVDDYAYCETIIKQKSKSFYFAFSRLPKEKAQAVYGIYCFCRRADDNIDQATTPEAEKEALEKLYEELVAFEQGNEPDIPLWRVLRDVFNRYDMSLSPFYDQLRGQMMDLHFKRPKTLQDLEEYSYYVAGSVGLMLLPIIAQENHHRLREAAINLGIAMQLTNILRDVGEDLLDIGRIYLPESLCLEEGYDLSDLNQQTIDSQFIAVWERLARSAEKRYDKFKESVGLFDRDSQFPVLLAANVYGIILDAVRKNDYDCFTERQSSSLMAKMCQYRYSLVFLWQVRREQ